MKFRGLVLASLASLAACGFARLSHAGPSFAEVIDQVQPKIVKVYGAGGLRGLEAYQSGFLISDEGHILTVWSYVLDSAEVDVILNDGRKLKAKLLGADPRLEAAVLKIDATELPHFDLAESPTAAAGDRVLAFSNLFGVATGDEAASVQRGSVTAKTSLQARRGAYQTPYDGPVYVLDAMTNNPGAAGGALVDRSGRLLGMLGKELRNSQNNTWLNFAVPISELTETVTAIEDGKFTPRPIEEVAKKPERAVKLEMLGIVLVPDVLERTPPFIDALRPGSVGFQAGLKPDDLLLFVNGRLVQSCKSLVSEMEFVDREDEVKITVMRGNELIDFTLLAPVENEPEKP